MIEYQSNWFNHYELTINLIHLIVPFLFHLYAMVLLLINLVRRQVSLSSSARARSALGNLQGATAVPQTLSSQSVPRRSTSSASSDLVVRLLLLAIVLGPTPPPRLVLSILLADGFDSVHLRPSSNNVSRPTSSMVRSETTTRLKATPESRRLIVREGEKFHQTFEGASRKRTVG